MAFTRTTYALDGGDVVVRYHKHAGLTHRSIDIGQPTAEVTFRASRNHLLALFRTIETLLLEDEEQLDPDDLEPINHVISFDGDSQYLHNGGPF